MKILIVAATHAEAGPLKQKLIASSKKNPSLQSFFYKGHEVDLLVTGVGMTATAFCLGKIFTETRFDFALNIGICGSFEKNLRIGEVVNITEDCFSELGAEDGEKFLTANELHSIDKSVFPGESGVLQNTFETKNRAIRDLPQAKGITVNTVHGDEDSIRKIVKRLRPAVESMEGAAFLYACLMENVPCSQVRSVSNYVERRNRENWNIPLAIEKLNSKTLEILDFFASSTS